MMKKRKFGLVSLILTLALALSLALPGCGQAGSAPSSQTIQPTARSTSTATPSTTTHATTTTTMTRATTATTALNKAGRYTTPQDVAAYLHVYHQLPANFITKRKAMALGWQSEQGNLWDVTDQFSIGGDIFSNREGLLPKKSGRVWYECDVNYQGGFRGAERIIYSNDWLIYYTRDHYQTFIQLY